MKDSYPHQRASLQEKDRTLHRPYELLSGNGIEFLPALPTPDHALITLLDARDARKNAESYRGFSVGACGYAIRNDGTERLIKHGANFKNAPGDSSIDIHAEDLVLQKLVPGDQLVVLSVVGMIQEDHGSGLSPATLHPCIKCRHLLKNSPYVTDSTLIVAATPDGKEVEWGLLEDFENYHNKQPNELMGAHLNNMPSVFKPPEPINGAYDLSNPIFEVDTLEWDSKVQLVMAEWIRKKLIK
jgi:cytidine deaminase